ncbi:MAG: cyclic nucleotide-binding domain-containing protein [Hyphomicrobiales bacterium]|nr:cyclic nucleotide-binding domain-containing protein [Hyphomicrobiales bacterium]MBV8661964.1 cyclic nucleotide-binding domain-containing protein [Hyphomicrobiales bacterium]
MSLEADVRRMARTRPLSLLPREALQLIAFSCTRMALKAGQTLFVDGEPADAAYFVLSGTIKLVAQGAERQVEPDALIGEMALVADVVRRASARASEAVVALRIPREVFQRVLSEFPDAAAKIRAEMIARSRKLLGELDAVARAFNS